MLRPSAADVQEAALAFAMQRSAMETYEMAADKRPKATKAAYSAKAQEYVDWFKAKPGNANKLPLVDAQTLHYFIKDKVIGRTARPKTKKDTGAGSTKESTKVIGYATVKQYVNAIVDLYQEQVRQRANTNPHPRNNLVKTLLKQVSLAEDERKRANYEDRGAGTLIDGYTTQEQLSQIAKHYWTPASFFGVRLRDWLAFALSHYYLLRGETARMLELADLQSVQLENEGTSKCVAVIAVQRQGKTNQHGRVELAVCLRAKDVSVCPQAAMACYLFWRWHVEGEPFPVMTTSADWYGYKLLKSGKNPKKR
ncbi:hypothetical protein SPRG_15578 [Saprolegnia parasitica CBS 223.65]|uniref:Ndc10 domain-containing protein n=1 Tax=Saprolegnia parasitica (strain CBS 223.65) TaxID=695850 RepID=A0A067BKV8_SAPPC|nr:hypothetical protein SPRG_15578 [Saprolegnia parasitica CBS 223.65]KDO19099.1 hypothetical protein SPRG_15578 [Saprolegnia parasitica CBS 223.65]|eukprot:XP_012210202.1 hypothetical protein SPRG_15578 [Saprolegnia parasitica CBS 223.65]